ncbi:uncharacterized protein Z518_08687 [Rhinocladiella mackenziei CBS 650.93]|uniref:mRNA export factor MEX67 n=1 Tax=Rhinocladiella mackenziei CBS 650.93 TaxID=1442369 RepID=A0A0D2J1G1_9EURO|nr:uncharacterized protein Z518_08687 [Rhinocladiella mackenziei CBS 650.93]KIX02745.1 hypothetical protein Z518_08687 [Rhinocladiella mackenziei CBS 650.93]
MAFARPSNSNLDNNARPTIQLAIKGWTTSKLASTKDQGLESLLGFLEKRSSRPILSSRMAGRTVLLITIYENDKDRFYHLNGFTWAGAVLVVEDSRPPRNQSQNQPHQHPNQHFNQSLESRTSQPSRYHFQNGSSHPPNAPRGQGHGARDHRGGNSTVTSEIENVIISVIRKRYHAGDKHLILNTLVADPEILSSGLSDQDAGKVYKAIFAICENKIWETESKRTESVVSVSLRDNGIKTVQDIISLASVFPHLHNLDLANNNLEDMGALKFWKNQFRELQHLILTGNPVAAKPDTLSTLLKWYPKLKMYNNEPVTNTNINLQQVPPLPPASLTPQPQPQPPQAEPTRLHPEFPPGSSFGLPQADKPAEVLLREQMGLQFSFETKLKMQWVENCLSANNWDYATALANFNNLQNQGQIPPDAYIEGV